MSVKISVILSVYNGEQYIKEAIDSILEQSYTDFECIVIDDGSTDSTPAIITRIKDPRIVYLTNEKNIGLVQSLNKGLRVAKGELIARMDADDISLPDRFEKQVGFLDTHPEVGVLGTAMRQIDSSGRTLSVLVVPERHPEILWRMFFGLAVVHASVMMRREVVLKVGGYNNNYQHIEDTELWSRLIHMTRFTNLSEILYQRHLHTGSIISTHAKLQLTRGIEIKENLFTAVLGKKIPPQVLAWFSDSTRFVSEEQKRTIVRVLQELSTAILAATNADPESQKTITKDVVDKIQSLNHLNKFRIVKRIVCIIGGVLPVPLKHRLRMSRIGQYIGRTIQS